MKVFVKEDLEIVYMTVGEDRPAIIDYSRDRFEPPEHKSVVVLNANCHSSELIKNGFNVEIEGYTIKSSDFTWKRITKNYYRGVYNEN